MPIYSFKCSGCNCTVDKMLKVDDRDKLNVCDKCLIPMERIIYPPYAHCTGLGVYKPVASNPDE